LVKKESNSNTKNVSQLPPPISNDPITFKKQDFKRNISQPFEELKGIDKDLIMQ